MRSEPRWLTPDEVIELNQIVVAETGEPFDVLMPGSVEGAVDRPRNYWLYDEQDAVSLAVTLLFAIADGHCFEQGNKRTGYEAALMFLIRNGYMYDGPDEEVFARFITDVVAHKRTIGDFEEAFRPYIVALPIEDDETEWDVPY